MSETQEHYDADQIINWLTSKADSPCQLERWLQRYDFLSTVGYDEEPHILLERCLPKNMREEDTEIGRLLVKQIVKILDKQVDMNLEDERLFSRPKQLFFNLTGLAYRIYHNQEIGDRLSQVISRLNMSTLDTANWRGFTLISMHLLTAAEQHCSIDVIDILVRHMDEKGINYALFGTTKQRLESLKQ